MKFFISVTRGLLMILLLAAGGCATYSDGFSPIAANLARRDTAGALELLGRTKTPTRDRLLLLMNRGMLLRMQGEHVASNQEFAAAKQLVEELMSLSLREQSTALVVNDATRSYVGAPYEQVMLNLYSALNYLDLGQLDAARVEALQVDLRLGELADRGLGALFANDPFARYLTALIYEAGGELSDAMIAYRSAYQAYRQHQRRYPLVIPRQLEFDLLRTSEAVGLSDENKAYAAEFGIDSWRSAEQLRGQGELVFLFHNGLAPIKVEQAVTVPALPQGPLVRVALPAHLRRPASFSQARVKIGGLEAVTETFENIEDLAIAELERNRPAILARATTRAILKYQLTKQSGQKNELAGLLANVAGLLTERADTRSWMSLPARIQLARVALAPGEYELELELLDPSGKPVVRRFYPAIRLEAGRKTFISCHEVTAGSLLGRR